MTRRVLAKRRLIEPIAACACLFVAVTAMAQTLQSVYQPVILVRYWNSSTGNLQKPAQVREDGSGFQPLSFDTGDLSRARFGGSRYFLTSQRRGTSNLYDLAALHEGSGAVTVLSAAESLRVGTPRWSTNGARAAWYGQQLDASGTTVIGEGLFLGDVVVDAAGAPAALQNVRLLVEKPADRSDASGTASYRLDSESWFGGDARLAFLLTTEVRDAAGALVSRSQTIHVVAADPPALPTASTPLNVTGLPVGDKYTGILEDPIASPVSGDGRLMLQVTEHFCSTWVSDELYTINVPGGYDGASALAAVRVTTGKNIGSVPLRHFDWSPDGRFAVLSAMNKSGQSYEVYKIKSDGTANAVALLSSRSTNYQAGQWRP